LRTLRHAKTSQGSSRKSEASLLNIRVVGWIFRGWTGVVAHASQSADSDAKGLPMTKAEPKRVKLALYQAAAIARQWDPQLAKVYYDQMVHRGNSHYKAVGAVMSHLASRIHAVLSEQRDYVLTWIGRHLS